MGYWDVLYDDFSIASGPTWKSKVVGAYMPPGSADTPNDATGNANNGAWTGTEQYTDTLYGRGFLLNGSSHINCGVLLPSTPGNRTVLCRATANHASEVRQYAWGQSPSANNTGQAFRLRPRNPVTSQGTLNAARVEFNSGYQVGSIANGSETHSYAVVSPASATQGSDVLVYQDGTLITQSSQVSPTLTGTANNFLIGNDVGNDDEQLNGTVAELFVISGEITAQEAADHSDGPTPTPLTAPVIDEDDIVTNATYNSHSNGAVTETFQWQRLDGTWQDVAGETNAADGPADFGGVSGDYRLVAYPANDAGTSDVMATPSNVVSYSAGGSGVSATVTTTLDDVVAVSAAAALVDASVTATLDDVTSTASASAPVAAGVTATLDDVTATAAAVTGDTTTGAVTAQLDDVVASSVAEAPIAAGVTAVLEDVVAASTATSGGPVSAGVTAQLDDIVATSTAQLKVAAGVTAILDDVTTITGLSLSITTTNYVEIKPRTNFVAITPRINFVEVE